MEKPLTSISTNSRVNQEQQRLPKLMLGVTAFLLIVEFLPLTLCAATIEEEIALRGIDFYIPDQVDKAKRRAARESGFSLLTGVGLGWGVDDNIYRSPNSLEESGEFWGGWAFVRVDKRFDKEERLMTTLRWQQTLYPGNKNANRDRAYLSNWYTRPLTDNTNVELDFDISYRNDDATKITGEPYKQDYSYWKYAPEVLFVWNMSKEHQFKIGSEYIFKDYGETSDLNSLDWAQPILKARYRYRFGLYYYLRLWYSIGKQEYEEEPASLRDGTEVSGNPDEKHRYQRAMLWYSVPFSEELDLDLKYTYRTKSDLFKNYESYNSQKIEAGIGLKPSKKMEIRMEAGYTIRDYDNILGDNNHKLEYTRWNLGVSA